MRLGRQEPAAAVVSAAGASSVASSSGPGQPAPVVVPPLPAGLVLSPAETIERQHIIQVLADCAGSQTQAAKVLGMARGTLISRLKRYALPQPRTRAGA
jgi:two-component system response regulator AtoC